MIGIIVKFKMAQKLWDFFKKSDTITKPLDSGIKRTVLYYEGLTKKHTPVDTGRLRSSITYNITPSFGRVGTNVQYAEFVEYGTPKMEARHVTPGSSRRVLGTGPFTKALELLKSWMDAGSHNVQTEIEKRFKK